MVPKKQGKSYSNPPKPKGAYNMLNGSDKVKFGFLERWHVFSSSGLALWEK
jgi:hypothetical protein